MSLILLVDDDEAFRKAQRLLLVKMGYSVLEARNGKEALRLAEVEPPDVMLTDIVMPEKEGLETIEDFRRLLPDVKIIAMSGGGRGSAIDYLKLAHLMGADHTLPKPFSLDELSVLLAAMLPRGASAPASTPVPQ
jgi:DNA-binding response OmpR family regulator